MAGTVHTEAYKKMLNALVEARRDAGLSQAQLAQRIGKPASFVGKYELGERRVDVIELLVVLKAIDADSQKLIRKLQVNLPDTL
ncbi:helix-turn-helix domain-containing protein [Yoonia sp. 2307UL14-13]|uniref:helix-turn-helix domain-containing protein n=1 Tax=Yoonia sp. 2307UL14-13 TaxID=3126506 RepID=UPI0030EB88B3